MKNRYGNEYRFEKINENTYTILGDLDYWRFGGIEGQDEIDMNNLGFVDPSGGPFIELGMKIENRKIVRISADGDLNKNPNIQFELE